MNHSVRSADVDPALPAADTAWHMNKANFAVCAMYLGEQIDVRRLTLGRRLAARPLTLVLDDGGMAVVFRYGAVVWFDATTEQIERFCREISPLIKDRYAPAETEVVTVHIDATASERLESGVATLQDSGLLKLQTLACVLGKTVALGQYEDDIAANFDRIEPFARQLEASGRGGGRMRELQRHIGRTLLNEHKLLGRVEVADKPELLWDYPELEPLYARLEAEYELNERAALLDRKLELMSRTVRTAVELLENQRSLRVEWYIVALILVEIGLSLYELFLHRP